MAETQVIDMVGVNDAWLKLMLRFVNSTDTVHLIECRDKKQATIARYRINDLIRSRETWFNMLVVQRGINVYVIKLGGTKKVRIIDGK